MIKLVKKLLLIIFIGLISCINLYAYETSAKISDREIVESLTELKQGQQAINQRIDDLVLNFNKRLDVMSDNIDKRFDIMNDSIDKRFAIMNDSINKRLEAVDKRFEEMHNTMLTLYTSTMALVIALIGYLIWDRKSSHIPLKRKVDDLEAELDLHLDFKNPSGPVLKRMLNSLRKLAENDEKLAAVLRSYSLL